ncbi:MAG: NCS1 family nucleobase:cation symporter-1 [Hyphomicrobiales bacterium]|nr:NCS1 family nucleobase:cation symporter-1 [Hyphomicrobiales bacterium]
MSTLYNEDLAPLSKEKRTWGWFEIFNVWSNDIQSLFGYTLAASLFLSYGLSGWSVFSAIIVAGIVVMVLVNLMGKPSVEHGIPFPVMARVSMGTRGANFPAVLRAIVAIFWYGAQTYFASTAVALLLRQFVPDTTATMLGMTAVDWISFLIVWGFQVALFMRGIDMISKFLNFAGVLVYIIMIILTVVMFVYAGGPTLIAEIGTIFTGIGDYTGSGLGAWFTVCGTMIAYFAAVVINYGDFSRFVKSEEDMKKGNLLGLPLNIAFFSLIALIITAGTVAVFGESITNPTDIIEAVGSLPLTVVAAIAFFFATVGINLVANFIPPAYDLANLSPSRINFKVGGLITSAFALVIGGLWVAVVSQIGIFNFVNTFGAVLAPIYGIMMVDYYMVKNQTLNVEELFNASEDGKYYYDNGWNKRALIAFVLPAVFSLATVWMPALSFLNGFGWVIGAALGGIIYYVIAKK